MSHLPTLDHVCRRVPPPEEYLPHIGVRCPHCGALPGEMCTRPDHMLATAPQLMHVPHALRVQAWERAGRPPAGQRTLLPEPARERPVQQFHLGPEASWHDRTEWEG